MKGKQVTKEEFEIVSKLEDLYFKESLIISENNGKWMDNIKDVNSPYKHIETLPFFSGGLFMLAEQEVVNDEWVNDTLIRETKTKWFWEEDRFEIHKEAYEWAKWNGLNV